MGGGRRPEGRDHAAAATVTLPSGETFRDFVVLKQDDVENNTRSSLYGAFNYRYEPQQHLYGFTPATPTFTVVAGTPFRMRVLFPGGPANNAVTSPPVFALQGHVWQEEPVTADSTKIGSNPLSNRFGGQNMLPYETLNLVFPKAGGDCEVPGNYPDDDVQRFPSYGTWGFLNVTPSTTKPNGVCGQ